MPAKIQSLKLKNKKSLEWININNPDLKTLKKLQEKYNFNDLDIDDCLSRTHRSKIDCYDDYTFIIFLYPTFIRETREIIAQEFDFWIGKNYIISLHRGNDGPLLNLFNECKKDPIKQKAYLTLTPERLLYEIHLKFIKYCIPMINHLDIDLDNIEEKIFNGHEKKMVKEISIIRRNITDYRNIVEPHKNILTKLMHTFQKNKIYKMKQSDLYFDNLIDYAQEIWNALDTYKERIEALQETNESLISFKINDTMNLLAIVSLITLPASLIAAIFGTNVVDMPISEFWALIKFMVIVAFGSGLFWFFRSRKIK